MDLVTGGTGIVGSHVLRALLLRGRPVRALVREGSDREVVRRIFQHYGGDGATLFDRIEWVNGDLLDVTSLREAFTGVEHVYHCAAMVSFQPKDSEAMMRANVTGTAQVVNVALEQGITRLCHVSSTAAIGHGPEGVEMDESMRWRDEGQPSAYALSKYLAELEVHRGIAEGLDAVMVNPCVVLGPGPAGRSSMTVVERLSKAMRFHPPGSNAVVDARDVADGMLLAMEKGATGERYLLIGENLSYHALFGRFAEAFGHAPPQRELKPWMLSVAWRVEWLRSKLTGSSPLVTKATAHSATIRRAWSSQKAREALGMRFRDTSDAVANAVAWQRSVAKK